MSSEPLDDGRSQQQSRAADGAVQRNYTPRKSQQRQQQQHVKDRAGGDERKLAMVTILIH
ncbi:hypothetical protein BGX26_004203 [Mortierella sp. AD094]|nr:hypothetical protein BGX26_004203 [Mortierella sp. AD094]